MAQLSLTEAGVLKQILEDHSARIALKAFFLHRHAYHTGRAIESLTAYDQQTAMEQAFFANCYERGFSELEAFCKEQIAKAEA